MSFFAVLIALLIEQLKPLPRENWVHRGLVAWVRACGRNFDAGAPHHAAVVWAVSVGVPTLLAGAAYAALAWYSTVLALCFDVLLLYITLGFRQFSHYYTDIRDALDRGDEQTARGLLGQWLHLDASELPRTELLRHVIEHSLLAAHRHVFGVFFWFVLLSALGLGPVGAVLYRMAEFSSRWWAYRQRGLDAPESDRLLLLSQRLFAWIDHLPARLTAAGFAVMGNFEDAVAGWRRDASLWQQPNEGVILASAAGALGLQLGGAAAPGVTPDRSRRFAGAADATLSEAEGSTAGVPPTAAHLQTVVGLVWRSLVSWMVLLLLLTLANIAP